MAELLDYMIDISVTLSENTLIYPGDPKSEYGLIFSLDDGGVANVGYINSGIHHATHVDAPYHFDNNGKKFDEMPMEHWVGAALVVDLTKSEKCVKAEDLAGIPLEKYERILIKTKNSTDFYKRPEFYKEFIYLDKSACELFVEKGVKTVGLDYITVDPFGSKNFYAHKTLLNNDVCIIECINLENVEAGDYDLLCLPLKLAGTDGAPARVFLLKRGYYKCQT
jgi:arylformamidase